MIRSAAAYVRHPKGETCLDCGFLTLGGGETTRSDRILLWCDGTAGCPPLEKLSCTNSLWVEYDLSYFSGTNAIALFHELKKTRRPCEGFLKYRPGSSPSEHKVIKENKRTRREKIVIGVLSALGGFALALASAWVRKYLGLP